MMTSPGGLCTAAQRFAAQTTAGSSITTNETGRRKQNANPLAERSHEVPQTCMLPNAFMRGTFRSGTPGCFVDRKLG